MTTEDLLRIEAQIGKLAGRLNQAYDQINVLSRRVDDLLEQKRHLLRRVEKVEGPAPDPGPLKGWVPTSTAEVDGSVIFYSSGAFGGETLNRKIPGAAPFGKEAP